jgi:hypothetical protein
MTFLERIREQFRQNAIKRRLKAAFKRKPRPARVIPPKDEQHE